jgi:hypothetical protein
MLGSAAVTMWWNVSPEVQPEWEEWHTYEHMPERLATPGFLRGSRWVSGQSYFVLYEVAEITTLTTGLYLERLNNPTPWSRKMMPHHRDMVRSLCAVRASHGQGLPSAMATLRFSPGKDLPQLPARKGVTGAHLLQSQPMPGMTAEQKIRGGDATADWVLLVGGYDAEAVRRAAEEPALPGATRNLYRLSYSLAKP